MYRFLGLARSLLTYYGNPLQARRLQTLYGRLLQPGDLYFDIGAHVGNRVAAALSAGANVIALEPNPFLADFLMHRFGGSPRITILTHAVGPQSGQTTLYVSERTPTVSSTSTAWIDAIARDRSFRKVRWDSAVDVPMTSLDALIERYGRPAYCKIDVEGLELEVLKGLSSPVPTLSFEFIPALADLTRACIHRLGQIAAYEYNWTVGEEARLRSAGWNTADEMKALLDGYLLNGKSGDIYARQVAEVNR